MSAVPSVRIHTAALRGVEALPVVVEASASAGLPGIDIVGMPDSAVLEARSRVRCALRAAGFTVPRMHVTLSLAPADMRKTGTAFDLPMAVAILVATEQLPCEVVQNCLLVGELGLAGTVEPVRGVVAYARLAAHQHRTLITADKSDLMCEQGLVAYGLKSLSELREEAHLRRLSSIHGNSSTHEPAALDFSDVVDQDIPKRAMTIAAAGGHGLLMVGPPGSGKTMLARRLPTILPPLTEEEQAQALLIHSVAGEPTERIAQGIRPFRAPHHSISLGGLVGGGRPVLPGEVSLANGGVLFLDELPEFGRHALQSLRQPLEDKEVRIVRVDGVYRFPCNFQLIAAANPCPCGHLGDPSHECTCTPTRIQSYQSRVGGPLMDRIDVAVSVARPRSIDVIRSTGSTSSFELRQQVRSAQNFAAWRRQHGWTEIKTVADVRLSSEAQTTFESLAERLGLGGRAIIRVARVARTIADLDEREAVSTDDILEAASFRSRKLL